MTQTLVGVLLAVASMVALGFLIYTLGNLERLGIPLLHGRVIVEATCCVAFGAGAVLLLA